MLFLLDMGNTSARWAWCQNALGPVDSHPHREMSVADLAQRYWIGRGRPERMVVANVAGERRAAELAGWARAHWGLDAEFLVSPRAELGVTNGYTRPEALGVDRWLGLTAAKSLVTGAVLVVDCGTAVTVDVLDADGRHRGGLIAPGLDMMREALRTGTRIPPFEDTHFSLDFGVDTASGISAGIMHSISGMVEKALRSARVVVCEEPQVILTGSGAAALSNALEGSLPLRVEPELVMRGLYLSAAEKEK